MMNSETQLKIINSKLAWVSCLVLALFSGSVVATEYVPPPTGPYKSSVVINRSGEQTAGHQSVYKFPPADLIQRNDIDPDFQSEMESRPPVARKTERESPLEPVLPSPRQTPPQQAYDSQMSYGNSYYQNYGQPGYYSGSWGNQYYPYVQQYPYAPSYPYEYNQNNYVNGPFNGMPSPWSVMKTPPFFSGE